MIESRNPGVDPGLYAVAVVAVAAVAAGAIRPRRVDGPRRREVPLEIRVEGRAGGGTVGDGAGAAASDPFSSMLDDVEVLVGMNEVTSGGMIEAHVYFVVVFILTFQEAVVVVKRHSQPDLSIAEKRL